MNTIKNYDSESESNSEEDIYQSNNTNLVLSNKKHKRDFSESNNYTSTKKIKKIPPLPSIIRDRNYRALNPHKPLPPVSSSNKPLTMRGDKVPIKKPLHQLYTSIEFTPTESQCESLDYLVDSVNFTIKNITGSNKDHFKSMSSFQSVYKSPLKYIIPLHVSLSPNFKIPLKKSIQVKENLHSVISKFKPSSKPSSKLSNLITCQTFQIYPNISRSSSFLALGLSPLTKSNISELTTLIHSTISETIKPEELTTSDNLKWDDSKLHISIAESTGIFNEEAMEELRKEIQEAIDLKEFEDILSWKFKEVMIIDGENTRKRVSIEEFGSYRCVT